MADIMSPLFYVPGLLFEGLVRLRNRLYDASLLRQDRLPYPVISIGNLTLGGSGKTPLVIHLAQTVARMGGTPALLSRGYGRLAKKPVVLSPGEEVRLPVQVLGDEPALVRQRAPQLWLGISPDRHAVGLQIAQRNVHPLFILDDGFQHRRLKRDLDIVVVDRSQPLAGNRMLPGGTLREPLAGLRRADLVVINGHCGNPEHDPVEALIRKIKQNASVFHCTQAIERLVPFTAWRTGDCQAAPYPDAGPAFLVAAIGNPERFRRDVQGLGADILGVRFFRDHFCLQRSHWLSCAAEARAVGAAALITTEKDAIKLTDALDLPIFVAAQSVHLSEQQDLEWRLRAMIEGDR
ncbi:MAG: tetraacyldisaccharide 4'-kinase [Acidobacteriia bacterium]|nr:tetraacyldisaccharide 4'-kinase [Terriglobia bacterium]